MTRKKKRPASALRRLHRSLGAGAALFVLFMVLSGLVINHSNGLGLDRKQVSQTFLLDWYGLEKSGSVVSFAIGHDWLSFAGSQLYLNERPVATVNGGVGAVSTGELLIAAGSDELLLLDLDGNLVERLRWASIDPGPIESIGLDERNAVLVKSGARLWSADAELLNWLPTGDPIAGAKWSTSKPAPDTLQRAIEQTYRGQGLSLEKVLLDLHSGRIFGSIGVLVYDLLALTLGFLSVSGLVLWLRGRKNGKSK